MEIIDKRINPNKAPRDKAGVLMPVNKVVELYKEGKATKQMIEFYSNKHHPDTARFYLSAQIINGLKANNKKLFKETSSKEILHFADAVINEIRISMHNMYPSYGLKKLFEHDIAKAIENNSPIKELAEKILAIDAAAKEPAAKPAKAKKEIPEKKIETAEAKAKSTYKTDGERVRFSEKKHKENSIVRT